MLLEYCAKCGKKVDDEAMKFGAVRITNDAYWCPECAKVLSLAPDADAPQFKPHARHHTPPQGRPHSSGRHAAEKPASSAPLVVAAGGVLLLAAGVFMAFRQPSKPAPVSNPAPVPAPAKVDPVSVKDPPAQLPALQPTPEKKDDYDPIASVANSYLEQYKKAYVKNPEDIDEYVLKLQQLKQRYSNTPAGAEAARILATPEIAQAALGSLAPESAWKDARNLLQGIDFTLDAHRGEWSMQGGKLVSSATPEKNTSLLVLPFEPPAEYDLRIVCTRTKGVDCVGFRLPFGKHGVAFMFAGFNNKYSGFESLGGSRVNEIPFSYVKPDTLSNGQRVTLVLQVRRAKVKAWLNGDLIVNVPSSSAKKLSVVNNDYISPYAERIALLTWESVYEIEQLQVLEVTGKGVPIDSRDRRTALQRGLWASYWHTKDKEQHFDELVLRRVEASPNFDVNTGPPAPGVRADYFDVRFGGILRVSKAGKYRLFQQADNKMEIWIDGTSILKAVHPKESSVEIELSAGDHTLRMDGSEGIGESKMKLRWQPPGDKDARNIPPEHFWYDPTKTEAYEKP